MKIALSEDHTIFVASTCRRFVSSGCYLTRVWMANGGGDDKNAAFISVHHPLPMRVSMENVTLCTHISSKLSLIG